MKLKVRYIKNKRNLEEKQIKTPNGWKTITQICEKHGLLRSTVITRVNTSKTYEGVIKQPRTYKKDRKFPVNRMKDESGTMCIHVKIGNEWKSVSQIAKETGKPHRTISYRIEKDIDPYQKEKSGRRPKGNALWEKCDPALRNACEFGTNRDLLAV